MNKEEIFEEINKKNIGDRISFVLDQKGITQDGFYQGTKIEDNQEFILLEHGKKVIVSKIIEVK